MPQKAFEGVLLQVRAYAIFPQMLQNRTYSILVLFLSDSENGSHISNQYISTFSFFFKSKSRRPRTWVLNR